MECFRYDETPIKQPAWKDTPLVKKKNNEGFEQNFSRNRIGKAMKLYN